MQTLECFESKYISYAIDYYYYISICWKKKKTFQTDLACYTTMRYYTYYCYTYNIWRIEVHTRAYLFIRNFWLRKTEKNEKKIRLKEGREIWLKGMDWMIYCWKTKFNTRAAWKFARSCVFVWYFCFSSHLLLLCPIWDLIRSLGQIHGESYSSTPWKC